MDDHRELKCSVVVVIVTINGILSAALGFAAEATVPRLLRNAYGDTRAFDEYLQMIKTHLEDVVKIQQKHNNVHGFPGMLESIDCMHWEWKNCPVSWQGQYGRGDKKYPTIMLEAVASQDLWIWHAFYGMAGANNDINVLDNSPLFDDLLDDLAPVVPYVVNGVEYRNGYYLADGIYPEWASFVKSFTVATDPKHTYFKQRQESARKDVERAFGVLQGRWGLIQQPTRAYEVNTLRRIMYAGIIMHNMNLED
ncbi:ALP1-like protein [Tanacetum coccineum]|uniref:ALP1-like protein n=1 Tax=Tanacetum coccineum TaxID=301880 RepID=A0ABQ5II74_9ASTR